jgi:hypothetical protein
MKEVADIVAADATDERNTEKPNGRLSPTHDEIAHLAFSLYESRGSLDGNDIDDWLRAEQELMRYYS